MRTKGRRVDISPDFSTLGLALTVPLAGYVLTEWLLGRRTYERMRRFRDRDPRALVKMFGVWIAGSWASAGLAFAVVAASPGVSASDLGVRLPDEASTTIGVLVAVLLVMPLMAFGLRRAAKSGKTVQSGVADMHPRTSGERWCALAMAVTAGICEEVVYRGFLIALGVGVFGLNVNVAAGFALALFAVGHLYQGWRGVTLVAVAGYALTHMYLSTGSLLASVVLHIAIDVFALVLSPMLTGPGTGTAKARGRFGSPSVSQEG